MMSLQNLAEHHAYVFVPHVFISNGDICTKITSKLINIDSGKVSLQTAFLRSTNDTNFWLAFCLGESI